MLPLTGWFACCNLWKLVLYFYITQNSYKTILYLLYCLKHGMRIDKYCSCYIHCLFSILLPQIALIHSQKNYFTLMKYSRCLEHCFRVVNILPLQKTCALLFCPCFLLHGCLICPIHVTWLCEPFLGMLMSSCSSFE